MKPYSLRAALVIGLAAALSKAVGDALGLGSEPVTYGVILAVLVVKPDFSRWPLAFYPVLVVMLGFAMAIGLGVDTAFEGAPDTFTFAVVALLMQLLGLILPNKLKLLTGALAVAGVLPLLSTDTSMSSWGRKVGAMALGLVLGALVQRAFTPAQLPPTAEPPEVPPDPPLAVRLRMGLHSPFFWERTLLAMLALSIGEGLGALAPKYLYFGVVLLFNDSLDTTLARVIDRMMGVSLGVLMPLLVFNSIGSGPVEIGLVMGGTAALVISLGLGRFLRTALISSGVAFVGYGPLVIWYIPNRWIDYLMGCILAASAALVVDAVRRRAASRQAAQAYPSPPGRDRSRG